MTPLLTLKVHERMQAARRDNLTQLECSLDLEKSVTKIELAGSQWHWQGQYFPFLEKCNDRTIYYWSDEGFKPVARFNTALLKLVPTEWGPPTFEIDGIKMLPTALVSPYADAERKVGLIQPRGKSILDTCCGLGYFANWCLQGQAARIESYEKNVDVLWLQSLNPWSPKVGGAWSITQGDVAERILKLPDDAFDAVLHDPPRFGIAGELYSQNFYNEVARVLKRGGKLFHYVGTPNKLTSGRDVPNEVAKRLRIAGFAPEFNGDGLLAKKR